MRMRPIPYQFRVRSLLDGDSALLQEITGCAMQVGQIPPVLHGLVNQRGLCLSQLSLRVEQEEQCDRTEVVTLLIGFDTLLSVVKGVLGEFDTGLAVFHL